jgi:hypothetical protein
MTRALQVLAGHRALQTIKQEGLQPSQIRMILGASGGPKWFVLSKLDQYLNQEFLPRAEQSIQLVGSSVGAWRMACYAQQDPVAAIKRFEDRYLHQTYSKNADANEVSTKALAILKDTLGPDGGHQILSNHNRHLNVVTSRCHGWVESEKTGRQMAGVVASAAVNLLSRNQLYHFYERVVFSQNMAESPFRQLAGVQGRISFLNEMNLLDALMASGAIPLVLEGVAGIAGAPEGIYRDGGLVDYHFDLPFKADNGIILYPHFAPILKPGWFDKSLPWRQVSPNNYADVVLLTPTPEFIRHLPHGRIPNRNDFRKLDDKARELFWKNTVSLSQRLADDLDEMLHNERLEKEVKPLLPDQLRGS